MIWLLPLLGLVIGIGLGLYSEVIIPLVFSQYLSIALLAAVDGIFGGYLGVLEKKFDSLILLSGFLCNTFFGIFVTYIGNRLGVELYLAVIFVFVFRIFTNFGILRRLLIQKYRHKKRKMKIAKERGGEVEE